MTETVVKASTGRDLGTRASRRLRNEGNLPAVVYGRGKDPVAVSVLYTDLRDALNTESGLNTLLTLDIDGAPETVLCRSVQRDPIKRVATHADFLRVDPDVPVTIKVPIRLVGDSTAVTSVGGMVEQKRFELEIDVAPSNIPEAIEADMSMMSLDRRIAVADLNLPSGATTRVPGEISIAAPVIPRAVLKSTDADGEEVDGEATDEAGDADGGDDAGGDAESDGE